MTETSATHLTISCPHCHADNEMTIEGVADEETITCSRCNASLGLWTEVKAIALGEAHTGAA